jgi:CubicO group peptidase (beta-lactamase class C family)
MRRSLVVTAVVLLVLITLPLPVGAQPAPLRGLDAYVERAMRDWEVPGLAIAVVRRDSVIFARGYGVRELGGSERVDEHTRFAIASTSKAFTTAALGMLVDEGRVRWNDPVAEHLPGLVLQDPWLSRELTVRDLVTHRAGLSRSDNLWIAAPFDRAEVLRRVRYLPASSFRADYGYNNLMYIAAGEVVGAASGTSWDDFLAQRIFAPLGMTRSTTRTAVVDTGDNVASSHSKSDGAVVVMARRNYDNLSTSNLQQALMYRVLDALLGLPARDWSAEYLELLRRSEDASARQARAVDSARVADTRPSLAIDAYAGTYANDVFGELRIAVEDGRLVLSYAPDYVADLVHWHHDTFRGQWRRTGFGRAFVTFSLNTRAQAASVNLEGFGDFRRQGQGQD